MTWYPENPNQKQWRSPSPANHAKFRSTTRPFKGAILVFSSTNLPYVRGETKWTGPHRNLSLTATFIAVAGIFGLIMLFLCIKDTLYYNDFQQNGIEVSAEVSNGYVFKNKRGDLSYALAYSFILTSADGAKKTFTAQQTVDEVIFNAHRSDLSTISIRYLSSNPNISEISGTSHFGLEILEMGLAIVSLAVASFMVWYTVRDINFNRLLTEKGQPILGTIKQARIVEHEQGKASLRFSYSFITPAGRTISADHQLLTRVEIYEQLQIKPGTAVGIVYADDSHFKVL